MQKHDPEGNGSSLRSTAILTITAIPDASKHGIRHAVSDLNAGSTSLLLGGMTKARVPELTRIAGSDTFTYSPSFGPEPVVGFGGYKAAKT
jgi:hypothetical protein